jgi:hypothetical protein
MKKGFTNFARFCITAVLLFATSAAFGGTIATLTGLPVVPTVGVVFAGSSILHLSNIERTGMAFMAIDAEVWSRVLVENLFKDNQFLNAAFNADEYVLNGAVVHIPNAGSKPTVVKNRSSFPGTAVRRTDTDTTYALDTYTTDPTHITKREQEAIAYDKVTNILSEHIATLSEVISDAMLEKWSATAAGNIVRTTGANVAAHAASATGNRKKLLKDDIKALQTAMNKANVLKTDRYLLLDSEMYGQLQDDADLIKRDTGAELDMKNGIVMRLYGFQLFERSTALRYDNAGTPVPIAYDAAGAAAHNAAGLAWQKNCVERALGTTTIFQDPNNPLYYGDVYSALVTMGGRIRRSAGVFSLVQAAGV